MKLIFNRSGIFYTLILVTLLFCISNVAVAHASNVKASDDGEWCDWNNSTSEWWDDCDNDNTDEDWRDDDQTNPNPEPPIVTEPPVVEPPIIQWPRPPKGAVAKLRPNGRTAIAPKSAPPPVKKMIKAANRITKKKYKWGGGHARWDDRGYDCSGAVSYVLHAGGLTDYSMVSGDLAKWGKKGKGRWIQIYANKNHVFMVIAGLRFDTSGYGERGPRWRSEGRSIKKFRLRHPDGL